MLAYILQQNGYPAGPTGGTDTPACGFRADEASAVAIRDSQRGGSTAALTRSGRRGIRSERRGEHRRS